MTPIFISYAHTDRPYLDELLPLLQRAHGMDSVWFDDHIPGGQIFQQLIFKKIRECNVFIYLISDDSLQSAFCMAELEEALRLHKLFIPVVCHLQAYTLNNLPKTVPLGIRPALLNTQWIMLFNPNGSINPDELINLTTSIRSFLQRLFLNKFVLTLTAVIVALAFIIVVALLLNQPALTRDVSQTATAIAAITKAAETANAIASQTKTFTPTSTFTATTVPSRTPTPTTTSIPPTVTSTFTRIPPTATPTVFLTPTQTNVPTVTINNQWKPVTKILDGVEMVLVPPGCFMMGSDYGEDDEKPVTKICFDKAFWIDRYEVTNEQFAKFGGQTKHSSRWTDPKSPRESITWFEARDFCVKRGSRLPTEAEWEYAARGPANFVYPWGSTFDGRNVVYFGNSNSHTEDVGSKPDGVSWVGAYDLSGNVWEWVNTLYQLYPYKMEDGRESSTNTLNQRVLRGGSWYYSDDRSLRATYRNRSSPSVQYSYWGFRCARDQ